MAHLFVTPEEAVDYARQLRDLQKAYPQNAIVNMTVYLKEEIPAQYHFQNNKRIAPLVLLAHSGWMLSVHDPGVHGSRFGFRNRTSYEGGEHGYDNSDPNMRFVTN